MTKHVIEMDAPTRAFYNGVAVANDVRERFEQVNGFNEMPFEHRLSLFWLFVGLNADRELAEAHQDTFIQGVTTGAPQRDEQLVLEVSTSDAAFHAEDEDGDHVEARKMQLNRILIAMVRDDVFGFGDAGILHDINGHKVGAWKLHD